MKYILFIHIYSNQYTCNIEIVKIHTY